MSWGGVAIRGDRRCQQKEMGGKLVNHGKFTQFYMNGKPALEGQFEEGRKTGIWIQYDEKTGEKIVEKYFERGVEMSAPARFRN